MTIQSLQEFFMRFFRRRRVRQLKQILPRVMNDIRVLDVGGGGYPWDDLDSPARVTLLNLKKELIAARSNRYERVAGDGRSLEYPDQSFDLVFSNSCIEHVGSFEEQKRFAREQRRVGKQLYCQTPAREFFVEPHMVAPPLHWLPTRIERRLVRWTSGWGWLSRPSQQEIDEFLASTRLLTHDEMKALYPDCQILRERFLGFTKSHIAVRL